MIDILLKKSVPELLIYFGIIVAMISVLIASVWALFAAIVFLIKKTRVEKFLGAEFDPERPSTDRRRKR